MTAPPIRIRRDRRTDRARQTRLDKRGCGVVPSAPGPGLRSSVVHALEGGADAAVCSSARRRACAALARGALPVVPATHGSTPCTCGVKGSSPGGDRIAGNSSLHEWRASTLQQRSNERGNTAADSSGRTGRLKKRSRRLPLTGSLPPAFLGGSVIQNSAGRQRYSQTPTSNAIGSAGCAGDVHPRQPHRSKARGTLDTAPVSASARARSSAPRAGARPR